MENVFNISWSNTVKIISWATGLLLIGIGYLIITKINELSTWIISAFSIVLLLSVYFVLQAPMSLKLSDDKLTICKLAGVKEIPFSEIEKILPYVDLYLMDIKHMDSVKHKEYTAVGNERILENAKKIAESGVELIIRTPVIPGFNDTPEEIKAISQFAKTLKGVNEHHLLPYHRLGSDKYAGLGRNYSLKEIEPPSREKMEYLLSVAEASGLKCKIGG